MRDDGFFEKHPVLFILLVTGVLMSVPVSMFLLNYDVVTSDTLSIMSLKDNSLVYGRFSLGTGYVAEYPKFMYYYKTPSGSIKLGVADTSMSDIVMDTNSNPYVIITKHCRYNKLYAPQGSGQDDILCHVEYYQFHVPNDTVIIDYALDGEM